MSPTSGFLPMTQAHPLNSLPMDPKKAWTNNASWLAWEGWVTSLDCAPLREVWFLDITRPYKTHITVTKTRQVPRPSGNMNWPSRIQPVLQWAFFVFSEFSEFSTASVLYDVCHLKAASFWALKTTEVFQVSGVSLRLYHLVMTNSLPWKDPPCYS